MSTDSQPEIVGMKQVDKLRITERHDSNDKPETTKDTCDVQTTQEFPTIKQEQRSPQPAVDAHVAVKFTNFFIDEILKPHFGKTDVYNQHHSPFPHCLKSECSLLTEKFSGIIHRPLPTFKQATKPNSVQCTALDLTRDRAYKTDKTKLDCADVLRRSPVQCSAPKKACSPGVVIQSSTGETTPRSPSPASSVSSTGTSPGSAAMSPKGKGGDAKGNNLLWPAWVYCTRYSDRPSSGPRSRRNRRKEKVVQEKRPRTAFSASQLDRLKKEFDQSRYLTEPKRQDLARELNLNESQIKIWFQNKRAKLKKSTGGRNGLALHLMAQGLYNHSTVNRKDDEEIDVES